MLKKVELSVSFADRMDETASNCQYVCPDNHQLESWGDAEPRKGFFSFAQPTISPLFSTRQAQESLLVWTGNSMNYHDYLQQYWSKNFKDQTATMFTNTWNKMLQDGAWEGPASAGKTYNASTADMSAASAFVASMKESTEMELVLYEKTGLGNGNQANNPWLQELPDPISKITWDNYLCVSPKDAKEKGWLNDSEPGTTKGVVVMLKANGTEIKVPVMVQPGQAPVPADWHLVMEERRQVRQRITVVLMLLYLAVCPITDLTMLLLQQSPDP
jgi:molybdopterin-containing oxidoreductase family iron-sulfur binding subunit